MKINLLIVHFTIQLISFFYSPDFYCQTPFDNETISTIGSSKISISEFETVFIKNKKKETLTSKSFREYLQLYALFKMKLIEAESMSLDTLQSYKSELAGYRKQLAAPYLTDKNVNDALLKEAYDRMKTEVKAQHILIRIEEGALPKDTIEAYTHLMIIRDAINGKPVSAGKLAEYESILKKSSAGLSKNSTKKDTVSYNAKLDAVKNLNATTISGTDKFSEVAKKTSEDPSALENGGDLGYFSSLQMVYPFENTAYKTNIDEISMPIRTRFGYHIMKVNDKRPSQGEILTAHIMIAFSKEMGEKDQANLKTKIDEISTKLKAGGKFEDLARQFSDDKQSAEKGGQIQWFGSSRMPIEYEKAAFGLQNNGDYSEPFATKYGWHIVKRIDKKGLASFEDMKSDLKQRIGKDSRTQAGRTSLIAKVKNDNNFKENLVNLNEFKKVINSTYLNATWSASSAKIFGNKEMFNLAGKSYTQDDFAKYLEQKMTKNTQENAFELMKSIYTKWVDEVVVNYEDSQLEKKYVEFGNLVREYSQGILLFDLTDREVWSKANKDERGLISFYNSNKAKNKYGDLSKNRDTIVNDYQNYLEKEWVNYLWKKYPFKINESLLSEFEKKYTNRVNNTATKANDPNLNKNMESNISKDPQKPTAPPMVLVSAIEFVDNGNKILDADEKSNINFIITNKGRGMAYNLIAQIQDKNAIPGIIFSKELVIGNIAAGQELKVSLPLTASMELETSKTNFEIIIKEVNGFDADPFQISVMTQAFKKPKLTVSDYKYTSNEDGKIKLGQLVALSIVIQNIGQGEAKDINVSFENPENVFPANEVSFKINSLHPNESKSIEYEFFTNKRYIGNDISIKVSLTESFKKFGEVKSLVVSLEQYLTKTQKINIDSEYDKQVQIEQASLTSDVDKNIPNTGFVDENKFALIIGNEDYKSFQQGISTEMNVEFANNDATVFKEYCLKTIGVPEKNITFILNGSAGKISQAINKINGLIAATNGKAKIIVYYAGHGLPDEKTKEPYLIPVDVSGNDISSAIKLSFLYSKLTEFPSKQITIFLDACFSGGGRDAGLISARGVKVVPKSDLIKGNIVVFTACSSDESSLPWKDKYHGMFTYFLLKKLQETNGEILYSELSTSLKDKIGLESVRANNKKQSPQVLLGVETMEVWGKFKLK